MRFKKFWKIFEVWFESNNLEKKGISYWLAQWPCHNVFQSLIDKYSFNWDNERFLFKGQMEDWQDKGAGPLLIMGFVALGYSWGTIPRLLDKTFMRGKIMKNMHLHLVYPREPTALTGKGPILTSFIILAWEKNIRYLGNLLFYGDFSRLIL